MKRMKRREGPAGVGTVSVIGILYGMLASSLLTAQTTTFDPGTDFSLTDNPNGVWQYGYSATRSLAPDQFRLSEHVDDKGAVAFWHPSKDGEGQGYYPYIAFNKTKAIDGTQGWAIRAGEVAMEASNSGQYSLVRFVAPKAGTYQVTVRFEGIHTGPSTTDVHVLHNATPLFDTDIDGYGGDSTFHEVQGLSPVASYTGVVRLKKGDNITFAVGYGKNQSHYGDTTGLIAQITPVGDKSKARKRP
jgi:hypothetical protein